MPPQVPTKPDARTYVLAFRLSEAEHTLLAQVARREKRKMADWVYLIVTDALESYDKRLPVTTKSPSAES